MKKKFKLIGAAVLSLLFAITACPTTTPEKEKDPDTNPTIASMPFITVHPTSVDYLTSETIDPLIVEFKVSAAGNLSYQWYENTSLSNQGGAEIADAINATYQPASKSEGFYYVKINNSSEDGLYTATSNPARIRMVSSAPAPLSVRLTVDTDTTYNYVRGFGGALNVWGEPDVTPQEIERLYNPDTGLGYNFLRVCLYPYLDDVVSNIEIPAVDRSDYFINVQRVNRYGGYVLASPWTPPAEMKDPPQRQGGSSLRPDMYQNYARHLKDFAQRMYDEGAPIYALSIQNEPDYAAGYDGCEWTRQEELDFFLEVGRFINGVPGWGGGQAIPSVKIMPGESANNNRLNNNVVTHATARDYIDIVGYHIYGPVTSLTAYTQAHDLGIETWMTEHIYTNTGDRFADPMWRSVWSVANEVHLVVGVLNSSAFNAWWIKRFYGLIGDDGLNEGGGNRNFSYPAPPDGQPTWRGYALSHFAKFAKETWRVKLDAAGIPSNAWNAQVNSNGASSGVHGTAYKTEDGNSISLVFHNQSRTTGYNDIQIDLPANFTARSAWAIITTSSDDTAMSTDNVTKKIMEPHPITLLPGRQSAVLSFPESCIISVKFVK